MEPFLRGLRLVRPRLHVRRPPGGLGGRAGQHRRLRGGGHPRATCASTRAPSARCSTRCATSRSSATCAARATSTRSSWSRTATRRRRSPHEESETLLRGFLSAELFRRGLICRADDRGDPVIAALAAADRRPRAVRGDRGRSCAPCSRSAERTADAPRLIRDAHRPRRPRRPRRPAPGRRAAPRRAGALGAHLRAARPDAVAVGRRAAAHDRHGAGQRRRPARVRRRAWPTTGWPGSGSATGFAHAEVPEALRRGRARARLPAVRGALRAAVHRRSPSRPSRAWSTSSTRCCSARSPPRSACSASCSASAAWRRSSARWPALDRRRGARLRRPRRSSLAQRTFRPRARRRADRARWAGSCASARAAATAAASRPHDAELAAARARAAGRRPRRPPGPRRAAAGLARRPSRTPAALAEIDRLILHQAVTVVALELLRRRVADSTERRLAGDVLSAVVAGELEGARAAPGAWSPSAWAGACRRSSLAARARDDAAAAAVADALRAEAIERPRGAGRAASSARCCPGCRDDELFEVAERVRARTRGGARRARRPPARAAPCPRAARASAYHEARCALEASSSAPGPSARPTATGPPAAARRRGHLPRPRLLPAPALPAGHGRAAPVLRVAARADREPARATTAASSSARSRPSSSATGSGRRRRGACTATATPCATASARSRS